MATKTYTLDDRLIDVYFQKSLRFLYPLLRINTTVKNFPINTYLSWQNEINVNECKLVCVYELRDDAEFKHLEKTQLQGNALFDDYRETKDNKSVYVFNLMKYKDDVRHFLHGKYSRMSKETKDIILQCYAANRYNMEYMDSYLNPNKLVESKQPPDPDNPGAPKELETYFMVYARLMAITKKKGECYLETDPIYLKEYEKMLMDVGELCDVPNLEKETFTSLVLEPKILS